MNTYYVNKNEDDRDRLKAICQELFIGLAVASEEVRKGGDVTRLVDFLKGIAKHGNSFPYRGLSFNQVETIGRVCRDLVAHRHEEKKRIYLMTKINGKTEIQHETFTDLVGPIVEPNLGADEVTQVLSECKDVREVAQ